MPLSTPTPPYGEIVLVYEVAGVRCTNRFFYDGLTSPVVAGDVEAFSLAWDLANMTLFQALQTDKFTMVYKVSRLRTEANLWQDISDAGVIGGRMGAPPSQQTTVNITWGIDGAGGGARVVRGRTFLTAGSEDDVTDGLWTDTFVDDVKSFATSLQMPLTAGANTMQLCIWRPAYLTKAAIVQAYVSPQPKVLRSRRG